MDTITPKSTRVPATSTTRQYGSVGTGRAGLQAEVRAVRPGPSCRQSAQATTSFMEPAGGPGHSPAAAALVRRADLPSSRAARQAAVPATGSSESTIPSATPGRSSSQGMSPFYGGGGNYNAVMAYSRSKNVAVYGGGNVAPQKVWKMSSNGAATALADAPSSMFPSEFIEESSSRIR